MRKISLQYSMSWLLKNSLALAIAGAVIAGAFSVMPHILAVRAIGDEYKGIPFMYLDDEEIYLSRINEIYDGHKSVASPYFFEYKDSKVLVPPIGEYFYAILGKLTGTSPEEVLVFSKFLFPAILFLLVYFFARLLLPTSPSGALTALAASFLVTLGYDLADFRYALNIFGGEFDSTRSFIWTRPVNPITGAILLFTFLIFLYKYILTGKKYLIAVSGLVIALMTGYFFSFGVALSILGVSGAAYLYKKDYKKFGGIISAGVIGFFLSSPFWLEVYRSMTGSSFGYPPERNGLIYMDDPIINKVLLFSLAIYLCSLYVCRKERKELDTKWIFMGAMIVGSFLAFNQQIITGMVIWPYHFVQYTIPISIITALGAMYYSFGVRFQRTWSVLCALAIVISMTFAGLIVATYSYAIPDFKNRQKYQELFSWLNSNAAKDCVVLVAEHREKLARFIPAFTHCNVYISTYTFVAVNPVRVLHNFLVDLRLRGITPETAEKYIRENEMEARAFFFEDWHHLFGQSVDEERTERMIKNLAGEYAKFYRKNFSEELNKYRLDYIASESPLPPEILRLLPKIKSLGEIGDYYLYKNIFN